MLGWPGSWDERKTDKVWLGQPEANPFWKTWLLTFSLISFFFFLPSPVTRKIKTSSSSSLTTTNNKTVIWQKQSYSRSKKTFLHSASLFFFQTHEIQNNFFFLWTHTRTENIHTSVTMKTSTHVQSNSKKKKKGLRQCSLSYFPQPLRFSNALLGLAYIDIWDSGWGVEDKRDGVNAVDF